MVAFKLEPGKEPVDPDFVPRRGGNRQSGLARTTQRAAESEYGEMSNVEVEELKVSVNVEELKVEVPE